jgi:hypothetical protein
MKTLCKSFFALAALALVSTTAQAQTVVHLSGSTAYRSAVYNALAHILTSPTAVFIGSNLAGANDSAWQGTIGSTTYQVECHWGGSVTGIVGLTVPASNHYNFQTWLASATAVTAGGQSNFFSPYGLLPGVGGGHQLAASGAVSSPDNAAADAGFSDAFQATAANVPGANSTVTAATLTDLGPMGILPFAFLKSAAQTGDGDFVAYTHITDITGLAAQTLYGTVGGVSAQLLTSNVADSQAFVYPVGRDIDSGTRIAAFSETGFGVGNTSVQYSVNTSGGAAAGPDATVASLTTFPNASFPTLGQGYASGGNVATALEVSGWDNSNLPGFNFGYGIGYLGAADTDTAVTAGFEITAGVTGGSASYTAAGTAGNNVSEAIKAGDNVYIVSSTAASQAIPATPYTTVASTYTSGTTIPLTLALPAGTYTVLVDCLPATYVRPQFLTFNGVTLNQANINDGKYQFWEYEHFFVNGSASTFDTTLATQLINTDAKVAGYLLSSMTTGTPPNTLTASKAAEGKPIHF